MKIDESKLFLIVYEIWGQGQVKHGNVLSIRLINNTIFLQDILIDLIVIIIIEVSCTDLVVPLIIKLDFNDEITCVLTNVVHHLFVKLD